MKDFRQEIVKLYAKFQSGPPFAFSKFADGEWAVMTNDFLNNREFEYKPDTPAFAKEKLVESIKFRDPNYFIGTCCPCCNGDRAKAMREFSGQDEDHMTFANVFVNANYEVYKDTFLKDYGKYDVHLVANENAKVDELPFKVEKFYPIGFSAWVNNYDLVAQIRDENLTGKLFLFCCGPFGNILAHQLHEANKNNTYLDAGSTLNPWLQSEGFKRDYYNGGAFGRQTCRWE